MVLYRSPETLSSIKCMANIGIVRLCTTLKRSWLEVDMYSKNQFKKTCCSQSQFWDNCANKEIEVIQS